MSDNPMATSLVRSAEMLEAWGTHAPRPQDEKLHRLLFNLGYLIPDEDASWDEDALRHRCRMLRAGARMSRLFTLPLASAPNLIMMGGEARPAAIWDGFQPSTGASITGTGETLGQAFESCVGEGVEYLSQFQQDGDILDPVPEVAVVDPFPTVDGLVDIGETGAVAARCLASGEQHGLPAFRCLRLPPGSQAIPPFALSAGCGAGQSLEQATLHGIMELVERDAAALWWRGRRPARTLSLGGGRFDGVADFVNRARDGYEARQCWFLDITTDLAVPTVAAISVDGVGRRVACGTGARATFSAALKAAFRELCQMEMSYEVVETKLKQRGAEALNDVDRRHLVRASEIDVKRQPHLLGGTDSDCRDLEVSPNPSPAAMLRQVVDHLTDRGIDLYRVDLTRDAFEIQVVRVVAPALQLDPCRLVTRRLRDQLNETGASDDIFAIT